MGFLKFATRSFLAFPLTLILGCQVRPPKIVSTTCDVILSSPAGGRVELVRREPKPKIEFLPELQVIWTPPSSSPAIDFVVGFDNAPAKAGRVTGGRAEFVPPVGASESLYEANVIVDGKPIHFSQTDFQIGPDLGDLVFRDTTQSGLLVIDAVNRRKNLRIIMLNKGEIFAASNFDLSNSIAMDNLFGIAENYIKSVDKKYCRTN